MLTVKYDVPRRAAGSCDGPGVGNDDCACCVGSSSKRAAGVVPGGSGDWAGRPLSALGASLHYGSCIDRTCADRDADGAFLLLATERFGPQPNTGMLGATGVDDDDCPDAPPGEPAFDNRRMKRIRCANAEDCALLCPICWKKERDNELASRIVLQTARAHGIGILTPELVIMTSALSAYWQLS
jgi:hypothetical protein